MARLEAGGAVPRSDALGLGSSTWTPAQPGWCSSAGGLVAWLVLTAFTLTLLGWLWVPLGAPVPGTVWVLLAAVGGAAVLGYLAARFAGGADGQARTLAAVRQEAEARLLNGVELLGASSAQVRIAGVYALADVADTYLGGYKQRVVDVLCGYLRTERGQWEQVAKAPGSSAEAWRYHCADGSVEATVLSVLARHLGAGNLPGTAPRGGSVSLREDQFWWDCALDLRGAVFVEPLELKGAVIGPGACFKGVVFARQVDLRGARFLGEADFSAAVFEDGVDFFDAVFDSKADFSEAHFVGTASFSSGSFQALADFSSSSFAANTFFCGTGLNGGASFTEASFSSVFDFSGAVVSGRADFSHVEFGEAASFDKSSFAGPTSFLGASFAHEADFSGASFVGGPEGGGRSQDLVVTFQGAQFAGDACFERVRFNQDVYFQGVLFQQNAYFDNSTFAADASFGDAPATLLTFDLEDIARTSFKAGAYFRGVRFARSVDLRGAADNVTFTRGADFDNAKFEQPLRDEGGSRFSAGIAMQPDGLPLGAQWGYACKR